MTELCDIATSHHADKAPWCWGYTTTYSRWLEPMRATASTIFEVGVLQGASLRTWRDFFPNATIYGIDNDAACQVTGENRIKTFCGDGYDQTTMLGVVAETGLIDFFVDDAIHFGPPQVNLLVSMWPYIGDGGIYAIEEVRGDALPLVLGTLLSLCPGIARAELVHSGHYGGSPYWLVILRKDKR